ncbi:hypothetical protein ACIA98_23050 [Streptomyces sp. NPDC051366]|uniref:hypothetical protein n=1 Tax=Streptomyces sp. NPDC051366 TaxID=3365652 RepID=UPI00378FFF9D
MRVKRSVLGMVGVTTMLLTAAFTTGSAEAATPSDQGASARVLVAPAAPANARPASLAAASSPGISPGVRTSHVPASGSYGCDSGNLCTLVWDPTTSDWKIFYLYNCNRYSVYNWNGNGWYFDNQTGNPTSYLYNQGGGIVKSFTPGGGQQGQDWTPVYSVRNC